MRATLTGFETYTAVSRSCAILPQMRGELHVIYRARNWPFGRFAQSYAVRVSEFVRNISRPYEATEIEEISGLTYWNLMGPATPAGLPVTVQPNAVDGLI
jgi:hypothetical protein